MCLSSISDVKPEDSGFGFKVFRQLEGELRSVYYPVDYNLTHVPVGVELEARHRETYLNNSFQAYQSGFHIFLNEADAWAYSDGWSGQTAIRRVSYSGARLQGTDSGSPVVVADRMVVLDD